MKNIAYIELDTHAEIAENFIGLMQDSPEFLVDYFFSKKIANALANLPSNAQVCGASQLFKLLENRNYQLIIIGTAHRNFKVFNKICRHFRTAIIVHNQNFRAAPGWKLFLNIFKNEQIYLLKLLLCEGLLQAQDLYKNAGFCLVLDPSIAKPTDVFLPLFFHEAIKSKKNAVPKIVVPGAVSQQRRDYRHIFQAVLKFRNPFEIVLLGKASGEILNEIQKLEDLLAKHTKISYFTEKIPQAQFRDALSSADILWCPLQTRTEFFGVPEFYGKTKMSGNTGDAIFAGKYAVFPYESRPDLSFAVAEERETEAQFLKLMRQEQPNIEGEFGINAVRKKLTEVLHNIS